MNDDEFLKEIKKYGDIRPVSEAIEKFPVEEEEHKGKLDSYVAEDSVKYNKYYEIGDIVFVNNYKYENGEKGKNHLFVIISKENLAVKLDYFGMILSSKIEKAKYKENKLLLKDDINHLKVDSIVKTDIIYMISEEEITFKIGKVDSDKIKEYREAYLEIKKKTL